jgi:hypothetical protein
MSSPTHVPIIPSLKGVEKKVVAPVVERDPYPPMTMQPPEPSSPTTIIKHMSSSDSYNKYLIICVAVVLVVLIITISYMATKNDYWGMIKGVTKKTTFSEPIVKQQIPPPPPAKKVVLEENKKVVNNTPYNSQPVNNNVDANSTEEEEEEEEEESSSDEEKYTNIRSKQVEDEAAIINKKVNETVIVPKYIREEARKYDDPDVQKLCEKTVPVSVIKSLVGQFNSQLFNKWVSNKTMQRLLV